MTFASQHGRDSLSVFRERFGAPRVLIGMLHLGALPGTPSASHSVETLIRQALTEARIYQDSGFTALAIENMHDRPYLKGGVCLLYTSPSPRDQRGSRMPSSA